MKYRSMVFFLVALLIAGFVAFHLSRKPTSVQLQEQRKLLLAGFEADRIQSMIIRTGSQSLRCERDSEEQNAWRVTEPVSVRADRWSVTGILDRFETARKQSSQFPAKGEPLDLAQRGLDDPATTVTFTADGPQGKSWTVLVGSEVGAGDAVYVKLEGEDAIYAIKKSIVDKLNVTLNDIRSKKLVATIDVSDLTALKIAAVEREDEPAFELECEKEETLWTMRRPIRDLADRSAVEKLVSEVNSFSLAPGDFVVDDPTKAAEYGLNEPSLSLTFTSDDASRTLVFSEQKGEDETTIYAMNKAEPAIVKVTRSLYDNLRKGPDDLREPSLADFEKSDVTRIVIGRREEELILQKKDGDWQIGVEEPTEADQTAVGDLLSDLESAEVKDFVADDPEDLTQYGLTDTERWELSLFGEEGKVLGRVYVGADAEGETVYVMRPQYPPVLRIPHKSYVGDLKMGRLGFLDRLVLEEPRSDAIEIALEFGDQSFLCRRRGEDSDWELVKPVRGDVEADAVDGILSRFEYLRAKRYIAEEVEELAAFGLDAPSVMAAVTFRLETGEEKVSGEEDEAEGNQAGAAAAEKTCTKRLLVGHQLDGEESDYYAMLADVPRIFTISEWDYDKLSVNPASKLISAARDLRRLVLTQADTTRAFAFDTDRKQWRDADGEDLSDGLRQKVKKAAELLRDFAGVEIESYVEKDAAAYGFDRPFLTVELEEKATRGKKVVIGREKSDGRRFAKGPATSFVLVASKADVQTLMAPLEEKRGPVQQTDQTEPPQ